MSERDDRDDRPDLGGDAAPAEVPPDGIGAPAVLEPPAPPAAGGAPSDAMPETGEGFPPRGRSGLSAVRDNLEAIAFALVLALLLRHFCIEVFKIPTASMEPTLFGDNSSIHPRSPGDRILVDKLAYLFHGPERWDVVVFRYPLDRSRNFIKRVTGLPGEDLRIVRGDVWVRRHGRPGDFHPARKPRRVREQLYTQVYPPAEDAERQRAKDYWRYGERGPAFDVASWREFVFAGGEASPGRAPLSASLDYGVRITDQTRWEEITGLGPRDDQGAPVADVRVSCEVLAEAPAAIEISWRSGDGRHALVRLASEGLDPSKAVGGVNEAPLRRALVPGRRMRLEMEAVDGDVHAWVDGDEVAVVADEQPLAEVERRVEEGALERQELRLTASGGRLAVHDVRVDRDLYYTGRKEDFSNLPESGKSVEVPEGSWFMMGDNTRHSSASRKWTAKGVRLRDGSEIWWDSQTWPRSVGRGASAARQVTDVDGVTRTWTEAEQDPHGGSLDRRVPFVTRDLIVGKAFFALVFWPLDETFVERWRMIH